MLRILDHSRRAAFPSALRMVHVLAGVCLLVAGGCAGTSRGVLIPTSYASLSSASVDMLVATTRKPSNQPGEMFSGERGPTLSFAEIAVSIPPDSTRKPGSVQWPAELPGNPATDFVTVKAHTLDRPQAMSWISRTAKRVPRRQALVFIHGFNNLFEEAVYRFAQIVHDTGADVVPVLFTWPSRGSVLAYGYDQESTSYSRNALEQVLRTLAEDPNVGEITILAHSLGNWLALETLRQMAIRDRRLSTKIRNVLLAAPDVDVDLARAAFRDMGPARPKLTLFVAQDDEALAVSQTFWGDRTRLGDIDPKQEPLRSDLARDGVMVLDLTQLSSGDPLNHSKFAESPELVQLIGRRLAGGQLLTDANVSIGDRLVFGATRAAGSIGAAAGWVASVPVALVDPGTRKGLHGHAAAIGRQFDQTVTRP